MALYDPQELARMFAENPKSIELTNNFKEGTVEWQRQNLTNLMHFLWSLPDDYEKFNMRDWISTNEYVKYKPQDVVSNLCGTSACAAGHAAVLGIGNPERYDYWDDYTIEAFGEGAACDSLWDMHWAYTFPTPKHAALRIAHYLKHGEEIDDVTMKSIANKTLETV